MSNKDKTQESVETTAEVTANAKTTPKAKKLPTVTAKDYKGHESIFGSDRLFLALLDQDKPYTSLNEIKADIEKLKKREVK